MGYPGTLKLPIEEIYEGGNSKARNPKMQDMLRMIGFGENLGSGFPKIIDAWKDARWNAPTLEDRLATEEVRLTLPVPFGELGNVADNVADELTDRQRVILELIRANVADDVASNVAVNTKYLSDTLKLSRKTIQRDLNILIDKALICWEGTNRTGRWLPVEEL